MTSLANQTGSPEVLPGPSRRLSVGCLVLGLVGGGTLALLLGLAVVAIVWRAGHQSAIDAELARLRVEGQPITLDDLDASYRLDPDQPDATAAWQRVAEAFQEGDFSEDTRSLSRSDDDRSIPEISIPPDALETFLKQYHDRFEIIDHAVEAGSNVRFPVNLARDGEKRDFNYRPLLRDVTNALRYRHLASRRQGQLDQAINAISATVSTAETLKSHPEMGESLVRVAILGAACDLTTRMLTDDPLTEPQLDRLATIWADIDTRPHLLKALASDRVRSLAIYWHPDQSKDRLPESYHQFLTTPLAIEHQRHHLDAYRDIEQILQQHRGAAALDHFQTVSATWGSTPPPLIKDLRLYFEMFLKAQIRAEGYRNLILAGIAVRRYHNRTGQWPEDWSDLADLLPDGVPIDPFSGQPLKMVRIDHPDGPPRTEIAKNDPNGPIGTGLLIYGVGVNRIDDGGVYDYGDGVNGGDHTLFLADEHKPAAYVPLPPPPADEFEPYPDGEDPEDADAADGASDGQAIGITPGIPADGPVPRSGPPSPEGRDILNVTRRTVLAWKRQAVGWRLLRSFFARA